ncbi:hypothetical protein [Microtetraspora niveoalba]|uniref:hypothetical protein n=1 Tax=Microtetraspora niveoalba TaxID=46175 RepID=UPI000832640D|nr:hypothetical protein [Microtetraspora niveoalba]
MDVLVDREIVYGPSGKALDVYRPDTPSTLPAVLLWHGRGPDERDILAPLARAPDWRSAARLIAEAAASYRQGPDA